MLVAGEVVLGGLAGVAVGMELVGAGLPVPAARFAEGTEAVCVADELAAVLASGDELVFRVDISGVPVDTNTCAAPAYGLKPAVTQSAWWNGRPRRKGAWSSASHAGPCCAVMVIW